LSFSASRDPLRASASLSVGAPRRWPSAFATGNVLARDPCSLQTRLPPNTTTHASCDSAAAEARSHGRRIGVTTADPAG
jgi:hypothetical protein